MAQTNQGNTLINTVKVAVPTILIAPFAMPIIHGLAGIAVAGFSLFAAGSLVSKTVNIFSSSQKAEKEENISSSN